VNDTQRRVTILDRICDDAQRQQIIDLIQPDFLALHFLVNRVGPFHAAFDAGRNTFAR